MKNSRRSWCSALACFIIFSIGSAPLAPALALSLNENRELAVYEAHPELLKATFDHVTENIRATVDLLDQQQIAEGRNELERILTSVPSGASADLRGDFERLKAIRTEFATIMRGKGVAEKLTDTGLVSAPALNDAIASLPDTIRNHALFCSQAVASVGGAPNQTSKWKDMVETASVIGMIGGFFGLIAICSYLMNAPCVPD